MSQTVFLLLSLVGALGLFLYGMKLMSDGVQKLFANYLRKILANISKNSIYGIVSGVIITAIIQSSSATVSLIVSFINAGYVTLTEGIAVIMGANIGTTSTAWIIAFFGIKYTVVSAVLPLFGIGLPILIFSKRDNLKSSAEILIGISLLFLGLNFISLLIANISENKFFLDWFISIIDYGFLGKLFFLLLGIFLSIVLQSSSASVALTLVLAYHGWINFEVGACIILGENVGKTLSLNITANAGNVFARRATFANTIINSIGVIWVFFLTPIFEFIINIFYTSLNFHSPTKDVQNLAIALALFHTLFNLINTLFWMPFVKPLVKKLEKIIVAKNKGEEKFHLELIETGLLKTSELSLFEAQKEMVKFAEITQRMFSFIPELITETNTEKAKELYSRINKYEEIIDRVEIEIANFLIKISQQDISKNGLQNARAMLRIVSNMEKIGDLCYQMSLNIERKAKDKAWFTPEQRHNLKLMFVVINKSFDLMIANLNSPIKKVDMDKVMELENKLNNLRDTIREQHFLSIEENKEEYNIKSGLYYNGLYSAIEKLGDHILNINEAIAGIKMQ